MTKQLHSHFNRLAIRYLQYHPQYTPYPESGNACHALISLLAPFVSHLTWYGHPRSSIRRLEALTKKGSPSVRYNRPRPTSPFVILRYFRYLVASPRWPLFLYRNLSEKLKLFFQKTFKSVKSLGSFFPY